VLLSTATGIWIYSLHDPSVALRVRPLGNGASVVDDLTQGVTEVRGEVAGQLFCRIGEKLYDAALCSARGGSGLLAPLL
jgi:hypothetical protein